VSRDDPYFQVLNEVVVKRSHSLSGVSEIDCYIDGDKLARFQGNVYTLGLIIPMSLVSLHSFIQHIVGSPPDVRDIMYR
jgi:hypothetical protein